MRDRLGNILWGIAFIVVGVGFAGNVFGLWDFHLFFDGWWTLFIIVPCGINIIQNKPNTGNIIGLVVGLMLLLGAQDVFAWRMMWSMVLPVALVIVGLSFLFRSGKGKNYHEDYHRGYQGSTYEGSQDFAQTGQESKTEDFRPHMEGAVPQFSSVFNGRKVSYNNEVFQGAVLHSVFGGIDLDIRNAILEQDVLIRAEAIFGGINILVPPDVRILIKDQSFCGGISNKANPPYGVPRATLYIEGNCAFGGVDIK